MNNDQAEEIAIPLHAGEKLLWSGKPRPGLEFNVFQASFKEARSLLSFGIPGAFLVLAGGSFAYNSQLNSTAIGIMLVLLAIPLLVGPFFYSKFRRELTRYAVTNQRLVIVPNFKKPEILEVEFDRVRNIRLVANSNGRGYINITKLHDPSVFIYGARADTYDFNNLDNAKDVYDMIMEAYGAYRSLRGQ